MSILTKFQNDYKILVIKKVPEWYNPNKSTTVNGLMAQILVKRNTLRDSFNVQILDEFDKYINNEKQLK